MRVVSLDRVANCQNTLISYCTSTAILQMRQSSDIGQRADFWTPPYQGDATHIAQLASGLKLIRIYMESLILSINIFVHAILLLVSWVHMGASKGF